MVNGLASIPGNDSARSDDASAGDGRSRTAPLRIRGLTKVFATSERTTVTAMEGFSLDVGEHEIVTLIGPSGCGKSTLLRIVAGLEHATTGEVLVDGARVEGPGAERGLMFQEPNLFPWLSVRRNIEAGPRARGMLRQQRHEVDEFLALVGLDAFADHYPHQLSGGMAQRVALARALINRPRLLLLDEPLGALDQFMRMRLQDEVIRLWQASGATIVLVTHDIDEAIYMSDRIVVVSARPGRVQQVIDVAFPRPRRRDDPAFLALRGRILEILDFAGGKSPG